ncbi:YIP1 family protein [Vogesella oryzae]|uniref:YIP1 family protein n=1 Tax=Vogesella oryzae TaxID=1735285 RepID=UPI00158320B4|nr:YIP1 family protein [Vogesella oryzae]
MTPLTPFRMLLSSHHGWDELAGRHPDLMHSFMRVVLPASTLCAAMLLYAGHINGHVYSPALSLPGWDMMVLLFWLACWGSVHLMAAFIRKAVHAAARPPYADCYRLAGLTALPIWLSSLGLLLPWPLFNAAVGVLGLVASALLLYHGLDALFEHDDSVRTESLAYTVFSVGALVWSLLVALILLPLL